MIIEAGENEVRSVVENMTEQDLKDIYATNYFDDVDGLVSSYFLTPVVKYCVPGKVVFGARENSPSVASVFAMTAPSFGECALEVTKHIKTRLFPALFGSGFLRLQVAFRDTNDTMEKWVKKSLEGEYEGTLKCFGSGGENFKVYAWYK